MGEEIIRTDLTHEVPTERAVVHQSLRQADLVSWEVQLPGWLRGGTVKLTAEVHAGSALSASLTTLMLTGAICLLAGVAYALGVPAMTALIIGFGVSVGTYTLTRVIDNVRGRYAR